MVASRGIGADGIGERGCAISQICEGQRQACLDLRVCRIRRAEHSCPNCQRSFVVLHRSGIVSATCLQISVKRESSGVFRSVGSPEAFPDAERACGRRLCPCRLADLLQRARHLRQRPGDVAVVGTKVHFPNGKRTLEQRECLGRRALFAVQVRHVHQCNGDKRVIRANALANAHDTRLLASGTGVVSEAGLSTRKHGQNGSHVVVPGAIARFVNAQGLPKTLSGSVIRPFTKFR